MRSCIALSRAFDTTGLRSSARELDPADPPAVPSKSLYDSGSLEPYGRVASP